MINMLKKIFVIFIMLIGVSVSAQTLKAGVSLTGSVPDSFYGNWRVVAKIAKQTTSGS